MFMPTSTWCNASGRQTSIDTYSKIGFVKLYAGTSPLAADLGTHRDAPFLDVDENFTAHSSLLHAPVNAVVAPAAMSTRCRTAEASGGKGELR